MTLKELDKLNRADNILKACQAAMPPAVHEWTLRFDARRSDLGPQQSLMVILLSAIEQACASELRTWAQSPLGITSTRDEFLLDIKRLVVPLVKAELTSLLMDLEEERAQEHAITVEGSEIIVSSRPRQTLVEGIGADITREAASPIEERAAAAFDLATFRITHPGPEHIYGSVVDDGWTFEEVVKSQSLEAQEGASDDGEEQVEAEEFLETVATEAAEPETDAVELERAREATLAAAVSRAPGPPAPAAPAKVIIDLRDIPDENFNPRVEWHREPAAKVAEPAAESHDAKAETFAEFLTRKTRGLSDSDLANRSNGKITRQHVGRLRNGGVKCPNPATLKILAEATGIDFDELERLAPKRRK